MVTEEIQATDRKMQALIVLATMAVAAAPHAFFAPPLQLHMEADLDAFYGISTWAPAILGGVAFFFGVEFRARRADAVQMSVAARGLLLVTLLTLAALVMAEVYEKQWVQMAGLRPWDELQVILPSYAALFALQAMFWQGFAQDRAMAAMPRVLRVVAIAVLPAILYLPFLISGDTQAVVQLVVGATLAQLVLATLFETGFTVRACMAAGAVLGAMFIWFQQAVFL